MLMLFLCYFIKYRFGQLIDYIFKMYTYILMKLNIPHIFMFMLIEIESEYNH